MHQVFQKQVQPIDTLRFDDFLRKKEQEDRLEEELNAQNQFSFCASDSYDLLANGP